MDLVGTLKITEYLKQPGIHLINLFTQPCDNTLENLFMCQILSKCNFLPGTELKSVRK